mmetsp:Transcript_55181/g.134092  ORF Transcript_55181/g.134092 Transcript_55181/m.134092 type:complete len:547 (-) Transcript_55181:161-1801(-)
MLGGPYITSQRTSETPDIASVSPRYRTRLGGSATGSNSGNSGTGTTSSGGTRSKTKTTTGYKDDYVNAYHDSVASEMTVRMSGSKKGAPNGGHDSFNNRDGVMSDVPLRDFGRNDNLQDEATLKGHGGSGDVVRVSRRHAYIALFVAMVAGGVLATGIIALAKPGCFGKDSDNTDSDSSSSLRPPAWETDDDEIPVPVPVPADPTDAPTIAPTTMSPTPEPEPLPPALPGFPETCSNERIAEVRDQLTVYSCYPPLYPWHQRCSYTLVTKGCQGYLPARQFYANLNTTVFDGYPFLGVIIGWELDDAPVDTLYIGSHNSSRYSTVEWNSVVKYTDSCRPLMSVVEDDENPMKAQVMVVEWSDERYRQLREAKLISGFNDDEMVLARTDAELDPENAISDRIDMKFPGDDRPIHYMQINGRYFDHLILTKSISFETLNRTRFLSFEYNWKDDWAKDDSTLISLIDKLKSAGLTCYWSGNEEYPTDLWRITDCWSWHYESKQWAHVSCVNTQHDDVRPLKDRMELMFEATMLKNQTFGGKPETDTGDI